MVLFLAGLQDIPEHLYDAAKVDGAGCWALFRYVTLPGLRGPCCSSGSRRSSAGFACSGRSSL